jgi:hypothetical protein
MATEAFNETLKVLKDRVETLGLMSGKLNLEGLREMLSASLFPTADSTKVIKVDAGRVPAQWIITPKAKPNR